MKINYSICWLIRNASFDQFNMHTKAHHIFYFTIKKNILRQMKNKFAKKEFNKKNVGI